MAQHDAAICRCEQDAKALDGARVPLGYNAAKLKEPACSCVCPRCQAHRSAIAGIVSRERLRARLLKANIDPHDLADLVWHTFFADRLDKWVKERMAEMLKEQLVKVRLKSIVSFTRESIEGLE